MTKISSKTDDQRASNQTGSDSLRCACLPPMQQKQILIIEDEPEVCELLQAFIREMGFFTTEIATTVEEALEKFHPGKFFVVVLDLYLGNSIDEGMDLASMFRDQDDNVYIAVMSGYEPPLDMRLLGSIDDFLQKPIDYKGFQSKLLMWSIQVNRRLAIKNYLDERMIKYLNELARICEEQQLIGEQIAEVAEMIQMNAPMGESPDV